MGILRKAVYKRLKGFLAFAQARYLPSDIGQRCRKVGFVFTGQENPLEDSPLTGESKEVHRKDAVVKLAGHL